MNVLMRIVMELVVLVEVAEIVIVLQQLERLNSKVRLSKNRIRQLENEHISRRNVVRTGILSNEAFHQRDGSPGFSFLVSLKGFYACQKVLL